MIRACRAWERSRALKRAGPTSGGATVTAVSSGSDLLGKASLIPNATGGGTSLAPIRRDKSCHNWVMAL